MEWRRTLAPAAVILCSPALAFGTQYLTVEQAQRACFPDATAFEAEHAVFTPEQIAAIEKQSGVKVSAKAQQIWRVREGEKTSGFFIVDYVIGKHLVIDYAVALDPEGAVRKVEIMQYRESYGGEIRHGNWLDQFNGKNAESTLKVGDDITNIGGATLSSRHVTEGIKRVLATFRVVRS